MSEAAEASPLGLECLKEVIVAGEQLRISQAVRRFFRATTARLVNQYGPTETHVATEAILDPTPLRWPELPAIGRPLPGVRAYVVDAAGQLAPKLVPGELLVGGSAPALGYIGQPDLTQTRFVRDSFANTPNAIVYKTGDRARLLSDGGIEFLGRQDQQVKIRGYRVELNDLEVNAEQLRGVHLAVAKHWITETWTGLAIYLVLQDYSRASLRELRNELRERVPEYMVPSLSAMMLLDEVPLTSSGKVDRSRLPFPGVSERSAPETLTVADRVAGIWSRRLVGLGRVSPDDDFLDLGGHSLLAIQIVSEVNDAFNISVPLSALLRGSSLQAFTETVERLLDAPARGSSSEYSPAQALPQGPPAVASDNSPVGSSHGSSRRNIHGCFTSRSSTFVDGDLRSTCLSSSRVPLPAAYNGSGCRREYRNFQPLCASRSRPGPAGRNRARDRPLRMSSPEFDRSYVSHRPTPTRVRSSGRGGFYLLLLPTSPRDVELRSRA